MRPLLFTVPEGGACTVRHVLAEEFQMSSSHISRLKRREGGILKNGLPCYTSARCFPGDVISALITDPPETKRLEPMELLLDIAYEDEWLIVINKPAGLTVHPERSGMGGSVENALTAYLKEDEFVHTVSRLDRGTSGLMTVAKCGYMHERMIRILHTEAFQKEYLGLCRGVPDEVHGFIRVPIAHPAGENYRMQADEDGLPCVTEYEFLSAHGDHSLMRLIPHTGRMHQLRVHMAYIGHPLVGDWLYGQEVSFIDHAALHSWRLRFIHPMTGRNVELTAPLPQDIVSLM